MDESQLVVLHTAPDGRSLPTDGGSGRVLVFRDAANAEAFARGLVEAGVPEAILAQLSDVRTRGDAGPGSGDDVTVFEDERHGLSEDECREQARRLALELGPSILRRH